MCPRPTGPSLKVMTLAGATEGSGGDRCSVHHPYVLYTVLMRRLLLLLLLLPPGPLYSAHITSETDNFS